MSTIETPPMDVLSRPTQRTRRLVVVALLAVIAGLLYGGYWWSYDRFYVRTDNAYVVGNLVPIVAQASGIVTQVLAEETQFVNKGDLVIRLDEHQASAALGRARGHLGETVRRITSLFIRQRQVEEKLSARSARLDLVRHDIARYREASPRGAVSKQILQNAFDHLPAVEAEVRETQAEYDALNAEVGGTSVMEHPAVELAKHEFIDAHLEYERQQIKAPVSGYVAKRKGQVGDRVKPGAALMVIVPLEHLWVEANLRETAGRAPRSVRHGDGGSPRTKAHLSRDCGRLGAGDGQRVRPVAARQCDRQLYSHCRTGAGAHCAPDRGDPEISSSAGPVHRDAD